MSRYNPFAKPKLPHQIVAATEATAGGVQETADAQSQAEHGHNTDIPDMSEVRKESSSTSVQGDESNEWTQSTVNAIPPQDSTHTNVTSPLLPNSTLETSQIPKSTPPHPPCRVPTTPATTSRWRLLWRGGLEVGVQRYRLDGIAFCAKMSFGIPGSLRRTPVAGQGSVTGSQGDVPPESEQAAVRKEAVMRQEGSYFTSTATQPLPTSTLPAPSRPRRPLLRTESSTPAENNVFTPGGTLTAHAFATSDPDLCLSLESMKGRQTLRVRGVERLSDDEIDDGRGDGVHVCVLSFWNDFGLIFVGFRYLDPGPGDTASGLSGNAHSVLAQYIFNSICRGKLSSSERTRKALVVTLGDDVIGEFSVALIPPWP